MSYWETLLVIMRRWRISVPAVLVALGVGIGAFYVAPPSYEDSVQVLFLGSPQQPGEKALVNPYLELGSTLVSTADVIRLKVSTPQVVTALAAQGANAEYGVALDQSTPAPVLIVTSKDAQPAVSRETSLAVVKEIQVVLEQLQEQAGAPRSTWVATSVISSLPKPKRQLNASLRPAIVAAGGIFALTMFVLFLLEGRQRRRESDQRDAPLRPVAAGPAPNDPFGIPYADRPQAPEPAPAQPYAQPHRQPQRQPQAQPQRQPQAQPISYAPRPISHSQPSQRPSVHPGPPAPQPVEHPERLAQPTRAAAQPAQSPYPSPTSPPTLQVPRLLPPPTPQAGTPSRSAQAAPSPGRLLGQSSNQDDPAQTWFHGETDGRPNGHGQANGHVNGHANGHANDNGNGHSNGQVNGTVNGHAEDPDSTARKRRAAEPEAEGRASWRR